MIEEMRKELGEKAARNGEPLHEGASDEFKRGYRSGSFGSNVTPPKFGRGAEIRAPWTCICGKLNPKYVRKCFDCGLSQNEGEDPYVSVEG